MAAATCLTALGNSALSTVVIHTSRRTHLETARKKMVETLGEDSERIHFLMDHNRNRIRYEQQETSLRNEKEGAEEGGNG